MEIGGVQIPVAISYIRVTRVTSETVNKKLFICNQSLLEIDPEKAAKYMFMEFYFYLLKICSHTIYVHNLGAFDGYFIFKYLSQILNAKEITSIIDPHNKFISIKLEVERPRNRYPSSFFPLNPLMGRYNFLDSYRLFPVSLNKLCELFIGPDVQKTSDYKQEFNSPSLFNKPEQLEEFKEYAIQDSVILHQAMYNATMQYINRYKTNISTCVSTSSLSLKIFRNTFMVTKPSSATNPNLTPSNDNGVSIPILDRGMDNFIRMGYYGGATDYYRAYAEKVYHYDINSLYPAAMLNPMPLKHIAYHQDGSSIILDNFFGFVLAEIECNPSLVEKPVLPIKFQGKTIYPYGKWLGVYFSEELKAVAPLGYNFKIVRAHEFSKAYLFNDYIDHFYTLKKNAKTPSERYIAKLHLNTLYGVFGRSQNLLKTININREDIKQYLLTNSINNIININEEKAVLVVNSSLEVDIIKELNIVLSQHNSKITDQEVLVKSNVAIASAVTSYARISMIPYKLHPSVCYTDTDSVFTTEPLPEFLVGGELGQMKDELNGGVIEQAYFLGIKKYGYWLIDAQGNRVERSVIAGVKRNSVCFEELIKLFNGETLVKTIPNVFNKNLSNLNIKITDSKVSVDFHPDKQLVDNKYIPITIFELDTPLLNTNINYLLMQLEFLY